MAFIGRQLLSWRRSSGERRQQLKWLASGAAVAIVSIVAALPLSTFGTTTLLLESVDNLIWCGMAALPVSMGVAILRYRLYDIDRIISRTLAYAIVTGLLVGVYAALALAAGALRFHGQVAVAAATLAAAALFNPLRRRVQRVVDRRLTWGPLRRGPDRGGVRGPAPGRRGTRRGRADLTGVVQDTLEPAHVTLWLAGPSLVSPLSAAAVPRLARYPARSRPRRAG